MNNTTPKTEKTTAVPRPPVVAVLGHVDHGKSSLLDYIRKTNVVGGEAGGITQHLGAYEVVHTTKERKIHKITFLDTPGHEAFKGIRSRGASVADIAILVVSGEEGVKPQTLEAYNSIKTVDIPCLVALTKIDKSTANVERAKQSLAEHQIYLEGYGGDIPSVAVSSKTGEGVQELLDLIVLAAELHGIGACGNGTVKGFVIEADVDKKCGTCATLIVKEGVLKKGVFLVAENAYAPTRRLENFLGKTMDEAPAGMPVRVAGWSSVPRAGAAIAVVQTKRAAEMATRAVREKTGMRKPQGIAKVTGETVTLPLVLKADTGGGLEAVLQEVQKQATERVRVKVIAQGIGPVNESDIKSAQGAGRPAIVGFNVGIDAPAQGLVERGGVAVGTFDIIYKLSEWVAKLVTERTPKERVTTVTAAARILKIFTTEKDRQVVGGAVSEGELRAGDAFRILRRDAEIGGGKVRELQRFKEKVATVPAGSEFGAHVSTSIEIMPNDRIEAITITEQ